MHSSLLRGMPVRPAAWGAGLLALVAAAGATQEPNPPAWGPTVEVFEPGDVDIQARIDRVFKANGGLIEDDHGQFSEGRYALFFKPGAYSADVPVGYYTTVHGLGRSPDDVVFKGPKGVFCEPASSGYAPGSLNTFWRSATNFRSEANYDWKTGTGMLWAVSQASPLRRVHIINDLILFALPRKHALLAAEASGGYLSNARIDGRLKHGSQQQWFNRNVEVTGEVEKAVWSTVFVGCTGAPETDCDETYDNHMVTNIGRTPVVAEKPYITFHGEKYQLVVPAVKTETIGAKWSAPTDHTIDFERVYVARGDRDTAQSINEKLRSADIDAVVLAPGIYKLETAIVVGRMGQVVLGLGLATLIPQHGGAALEIRAPGVRLAGVLVEAGQVRSRSLIWWDVSAPRGILSDVFVRVGGPDGDCLEKCTEVDVMVHIQADYVIGDNLWLWRADHNATGHPFRLGQHPVKNGLIVDGDHVTMYGLAVEHALEHQTIWRGNYGSTYFYQSELPYFVSQESYGDKDYAGYKVDKCVTSHTAVAVGGYAVFMEQDVKQRTMIQAPAAVRSDFHNAWAINLGHHGSLQHVLNGEGIAREVTNPPVPSYVCTAAEESDKPLEPPPECLTTLPPSSPVTAPSTTRKVAPPQSAVPPPATTVVEDTFVEAPPPPTVAPVSGGEPNPPEWGPNVLVFSPEDADAEIQAEVDIAYATNGGQQETDDNGQFSLERFAMLFKPGTYGVDVPVGYYTTVAGLGSSPDDVVFNGAKGVYCEPSSANFHPGSLNTFWRSATNFRSEATFDWKTGVGMLWAVSQASPLRRVHVTNDLTLFALPTNMHDNAAQARGGFLSDSVIDGRLRFGSQQQWLSRNVNISGDVGRAAWSSVFVGCVGVPESDCDEHRENHMVTTVESTPEVAEKPYIVISEERYRLIVPAIQTSVRGAQWGLSSRDRSIDFDRVFVARADLHDAQRINEKLASPHIDAVVLTPGIYKLKEALLVRRAGQVVLGMGLATLVPQRGSAAIEVDAPNVRVAGVLVEAGEVRSESLVRFRGSAPGGILSDVSVRVGGPNGDCMDRCTEADTMMHIEATNVIGDNIWLWRADHNGTNHHFKLGQNPVRNGLVVDSDDVTMYGLAVDHAMEDQTLWRGENGKTFFYQSELPYYATQESFGDRGYSAYTVDPSVQTHAGVGIGGYSVFQEHDVRVKAMIRAPAALRDSFRHVWAINLGQHGVVEHVLNSQGRASKVGGPPSYVCGSSRTGAGAFAQLFAATELGSLAGWIVVIAGNIVFSLGVLAVPLLALAAWRRRAQPADHDNYLPIPTVLRRDTEFLACA